MKIGVFDSGVGGKSFVEALQLRFPDAEIVYKEDTENVPYGDKTPTVLLGLTIPIFKDFEDEQCDAVLVACNSVTTNIIAELRDVVSTPLVGVEPMVRPAAEMTKTKVIAVCATPGTLKSDRYNELKQMYAQGIRVVEPDCGNWAYMIEHDMKNELQLKHMIHDLRTEKVDVIVLGCTHYHWIEEELTHFAKKKIQVIQPIEPVLDQLERILSSAS